MSIQLRNNLYHVVVCDICGDFSYVGDRNLRQMPMHGADGSLHLCRACRTNALWCAAHGAYHPADTMHRQPCVDCGGLFTSVVKAQLSHCPACRRTHAAQPVVQPASAPTPARSWLELLFAPRAGQRH